MVNHRTPRARRAGKLDLRPERHSEPGANQPDGVRFGGTAGRIVDRVIHKFAFTRYFNEPGVALQEKGEFEY